MGDFWSRFFTSIAMSALCIAVMAAGHVYIIGVGVLIQIELFRELVNITYEQARERSMPLFRTLQWSWFTLAMMWNYSKDFHLFCVENPRVMHLTYVTYYSDVVIFVLYCILQITTVLTLRKKILKYQMSQLMWMILTICLVVGQYRFFALNVTSGLFWFIFPSALVIFNDTSAYIFGRAFGKKFIKSEFIAFSPNKTWEGFIGAAVFTITMSFLLPLILTLPPWKKFFVCPAEELLWTPFQAPGLQCEIPEVYVAHTYILHPFKALRGDGWAGLLGALASSTLPAWVSNSVPLGLVENMASLTVSIELLPIQLHGIAYGLFASVVAPIGGFMASAIKRASGVKDFENFLPGHGGVMDRMDCQLVMMGFTYMYRTSFIHPLMSGMAVSAEVLASSALLLPLEQQQRLYALLGQNLAKMGASAASVCSPFLSSSESAATATLRL